MKNCHISAAGVPTRQSSGTGQKYAPGGHTATVASWSAVAAIVLVLAGGRPASAQLSGERCLKCHSQAAIMLLQVQFADGQQVSPFIDKDAFLQSAHGRLSCTACHETVHPEFNTDFEPSNQPPRALPTRRQYADVLDRRCRSCHEPGGDMSAKHISQVLHPTGSDETPHCADCHQPHAMHTVVNRGAAIDRACGRCHEEIYRDFSASVHGAALGDPANPDLPQCTSCHSGHEGGGKSVAARRVRLGRPCMGCHGDEQLMGHYGLSTNVVKTYLDDFHGLSVKFYGQGARDAEKFVLVCSDCHGIHDVKPARGLASAALKSKLENVCRKCHEDATENFAHAWLSHTTPSPTSHVLVYLVRAGYLVLIPFVIAGLIIHIVSDLVVLPLRNRASRGAATAHSAQRPAAHGTRTSRSRIPEYFVRFSPRQRLEHFLVLTTFLLLVITGLPQKFHDSAWAETTIRVLGGIDNARMIHRVAGFALTAVSLFHFLVVGAAILLRKMSMSMVPTRKDFEDAAGTLKYHLGLSDQLPQADRFTYGEKFEYWGMILGTVVMVVSGFMLLYPTVLTQYLPGQIIAAARVVHSYEAMMALLTIVVWHMYGARFDPCIFTGKIARERLAHHHPLEYERLVHQSRPVTPEVRPQSAPARPINYRAPA